jgi:hypothetical protein
MKRLMSIVRRLRGGGDRTRPTRRPERKYDFDKVSSKRKERYDDLVVR